MKPQESNTNIENKFQSKSIQENKVTDKNPSKIIIKKKDIITDNMLYESSQMNEQEDAEQKRSSFKKKLAKKIPSVQSTSSDAKQDMYQNEDNEYF